MCEDGATVAATYLLFGETVRAGLVRAERAAILHGDFTGKPHKIPQMSYLRYETKICSDKCSNKRRRFLDFQTDWPSKTDEQMKQKNAAESENRLKNIKNESNDTKQLFIAYF